MANDAGVGEQTRDVALAEVRDAGVVETGERRPERRPLSKDREPGEPGLKSLQAQLLEQAVLVGDRQAPLAVVVGEVLRRGGAPPAAREAVRASDQPGFGHAGIKALA